MKKSKSNMSEDERAARRARIGKAATAKIAKREQLNFRLEEGTIMELQDMAYQKGVPVGTMVRGWVIERLLQEKLGEQELSGRSLSLLNEIYEKLNYLFGPKKQ